VIQATVIYLEARLLTDGSRAIWSLTGLLIRTAVATGLHRDPSHFPVIKPCEAEVRRRLWWHICFLDLRVGDSYTSELSIPESLFNTKDPTNLNDADLAADTQTSPAPQNGFTDVTFCLLRCKLWRLIRRLQALSGQCRQNPSVENYGQQFETLCSAYSAIRAEVLEFLDLNNPLHSFVNGFARLAMLRAELAVDQVHSSGVLAPDDAQSRQGWNRIFLLSVANLEFELELRNTPSAHQWDWIFNGCIPWPAVSIVLAQLCQRPWGPSYERAWTVASQYVDRIPRAARKEALHRPICQLVEDVRNHRETELSRIRDNADIARQLGLLPPLKPLETDTWLSSVAEHCSLDTSAAEKELELEMMVSTGAQLSHSVSTELDAATGETVTLPGEHVEVLMSDTDSGNIFSETNLLASAGGQDNAIGLQCVESMVFQQADGGCSLWRALWGDQRTPPR
jgi:hypothetical protein